MVILIQPVFVFCLMSLVIPLMQLLLTIAGEHLRPLGESHAFFTRYMDATRQGNKSITLIITFKCVKK